MATSAIPSNSNLNQSKPAVEPSEAAKAAAPEQAAANSENANDSLFQKALNEKDGYTLIPATNSEGNHQVEVQGTKTYLHQGVQVVVAKRKEY